MDSKEYNLRLRDIRANLQTLLEKAVKARDGYRAKLAALHERARDYSQEYLQKQIEQIEAEIATSNAELHKQADRILDDWSEAMSTRHQQPIDLSDPAITAAINLISLAGHQLTYEDLTGLVDQFRGNPAALRALRAVFETQDLPSGVRLVEKRTYDPAGAILALKSAIDNAFKANGSINAIAVEAWRVFEKEGVEFPRMVDEAGVDEALRAGAGLPPLV